MKKAVSLTLFLLLLAAAAHAGSPVWKILGPGTRLYLGGTFHILAQGDYPLPRAFDQAFEQAAVLAFETDVTATQTPEFARQMLGQMVYADGRTLKALLRPVTFDRLGRFATERGLAMAELERFKPGPVMLFLTLAEIERLGQTGTGVDEFYLEQARQAGKQVRFLEDPMDQVRLLAGIGLDNEEEMITYILKDLAALPGLWKTMKQAWQRGDLKTLETEILLPLKKDLPRLYDSLYVQRNHNWLPAIEEMLKTPETELVLVGAAHLAGPQGLLAALQARGFSAVNL